VKTAKKKRDKKMADAKRASENRTARAAKSQATRIQTKENQAAKNKRNANLAAIRAKEASKRRNAAAERRGTFVINNRKSNSNSNNNNSNSNSNSNNNNNNNNNKNTKNKPNMQNFKLYLRSDRREGNVTNETVKGLLNQITYNKSKYNGTNKETIRNVLNKILRRTNQPRNLSSLAINLKSTMFANNRRQLRSNNP
jgi:signal recognition particle GTPase